MKHYIKNIRGQDVYFIKMGNRYGYFFERGEDYGTWADSDDDIFSLLEQNADETLEQL